MLKFQRVSHRNEFQVCPVSHRYKYYDRQRVWSTNRQKCHININGNDFAACSRFSKHYTENKQIFWLNVKTSFFTVEFTQKSLHKTIYASVAYLHACRTEWRNDLERREAVARCRLRKRCRDNFMKIRTK